MILAVSTEGQEYNMTFPNELECGKYFGRTVTFISKVVNEGLKLNDVQGGFYLDIMEDEDDD